MTRLPLRRLFASAAIALAVATCATGPSSLTDTPTTNATAAASRHGARLYAQHCAVCHGADGDGDTTVAQLLRPRPNAFRLGLFKLVSTDNGMPSDDDLVATLRRGMPGSTMMSWSWLPDADLRALAQEVRLLAVQGRAASIRRTALATNRALTEAEAVAEAEHELAPGKPIDVGEPVPATDSTLAEGERLYAQHCSGCHGTDGRGLPASADWPTDGTWLWPRDFTSGYLRGAADHRDLALRVRAGMPGSHMPPTRLSVGETEALVGFVRSLLHEDAGAHHTQWRRTIRVQRSAQLPAADDAAAWQGLDTIRLPLAPLWWRPEAGSELWLTAAHDGTDLVLRLAWDDASHDRTPDPTATMGDGIAIQFAPTLDPPLFAMGSEAQPVNVWRWHAFDSRDLAGRADLLGRTHQGLDVPLGDTTPQPRAESLALHGVTSAAREIGSGLRLDVTTDWRDGRWTATFRRSLRARSATEVDLASAGPVLFAFAVWDGRLDRHAGSKAITTWHALELER